MEEEKQKMSATKDKLRELIEKGLVKIEVKYLTTCELCGLEIEASSEGEASNLLKNHIDEDCESAKYMRLFKPETTGKELSRYLLLMRKLQGTKKFTQVDGKELMELSKRIKI